MSCNVMLKDINRHTRVSPLFTYQLAMGKSLPRGNLGFVIEGIIEPRECA
jgi:hypothetical protein